MAAVSIATRSTGVDDDVPAFLDDVAAADGRSPLSDHLRLELLDGDRPGFGAITARDEEGRLVGYAQLAVLPADPATHSVEVVVHPSARPGGQVAAALLHAAADEVRRRGGPALQWWAFDAGPAEHRLAQGVGLHPSRTLLQLRRPLPTGEAVDVATRPFVVGRDEETFVAVNNRAFAGHPEQGGWTVETLRQREREPWFDPAGFLLHERRGRVVAFCWTKVHDAADPADALGEIYVIGVDPDAQGLGLGRQLTLAGLASLADRGIRTAMLYVDGANAAAVAMYDRLGFAPHRTDVAFSGSVVP